MPSIWEKQSFTHPADIIVVGAGLTGMFSALNLKREYPFLKIRLIEQAARPAGASARNAGFACFGSLSEILDDARSEGMEAAIARVIRRYEGLRTMLQILDPEDIGWEDHGGYEVFGDDESDLARECYDALPEVNRRLEKQIGFAPYELTDESFGIKVSHQLIKIKSEASLDSGKLINALLGLLYQEEVEVFFGVRINRIKNHGGKYHLLSADDTTHEADRVILATNAYTQRLLPDLPVSANRGQVLLTESIPGLRLRGNYHLNRGYFYFRDFEGGIMLGGGRHLALDREKTDSQEISREIQLALEQLLAKVIIPDQKFKIRARWAGSMAFGPNNEKEPLIKEVEPGLYVAARLGGMGVAMAPMVARRLREIID